MRRQSRQSIHTDTNCHSLTVLTRSFLILSRLTGLRASRLLSALVLALLPTVLSTPPANAQLAVRLAAAKAPIVGPAAVPAAVRGSVIDTDGNPVPNATVTLSEAGSGSNQTAKTDDKGAYLFSHVTAGGRYSVTITALGYPKFQTADFNLSGLETVREDARLEPRQHYLALLERDWHDDILTMVEDRLPKVLVVLFFLFLIERAVQFFVNRMRRIASHDSIEPRRGAQLRTMASIIRATVYSILGFIAFLQILFLFNINVAPLLTSAGIVGVGIGLAAQSLFKDIINGVFILVEDQYNVGETVKIASLTGTVEDLTLRLTRLRDGDGTLYIIPNSQVATVSNLSRDFAVATLSVSVDASADPGRVIALLKSVARDVRNDPEYKDLAMTDPDVPGIDKINGRELIYPITMRVQINKKDAVLRAMRMQIIEIFKREHIPLGIDPANLLQSAQQKLAAPDPTTPPSQQPIVQS